ncbi:MAG: response regulator [Gemmatimonadota bacterium]
MKVLLVDDEEDFVNTLADRLELRDLGSDTALSGEEALSILEKDPPDVMILDLILPGMDGMAVLRRVKEQYPRIQIIILTGHGTPEGEAEAKRLGAFAYLHKPVGIRDLMAAVYAAGQEGAPGNPGDG